MNSPEPTDAHLDRLARDLRIQANRFRAQLRTLAAIVAVTLLALGWVLWNQRNLDDAVDRVRLTTDEIRTVVRFAEENNRILCEHFPRASDCQHAGID